MSVRRRFGKALTREKYTVVTAVHGQEALEYGLAGKAVDAVLSDLETPRLSSFRLTECAYHQTLPFYKVGTRPSGTHTEYAAEPGGTYGTALGADARPTEPVTTAQLLDFLTGARTR